jgi:hypothetical protein
MTGSVRRITPGVVSLVVLCAGLAWPAQAVGPPVVVVRVGTGHSTAGGLSFVEYPSAATISGRVTTPVWERRFTSANGGIEGLACVSGSLCVAANQAGGVLTSSDGGASGWQLSNVDGNAHINAVSCPSVSLCIAVDRIGNIVASTDPGAANAMWTVTNIDAANSITAISCATASLCVAVDDAGNELFSTDPAGGAAAWTVTNIDSTVLSPNELAGVSCPSTMLCVAVEAYGKVLYTSDPTGGAGQWHTTVTNSQFSAVDCPSVSMCAAVGWAGTLTSIDPTGGASAWHRLPVLVRTDSVSCPTTSVCLTSGSDDQNHDITYAIAVDATGRPTLVSTQHQAVRSFTYLAVNAIVCPSVTHCVAGDTNGSLFYSTNPIGLWRVELTKSPFPFRKKPVVLATISTTGRYSFKVHPVVATRYTVTKLSPGPASHGKTATIYVVPRDCCTIR